MQLRRPRFYFCITRGTDRSIQLVGSFRDLQYCGADNRVRVDAAEQALALTVVITQRSQLNSIIGPSSPSVYNKHYHPQPTKNPPTFLKHETGDSSTTSRGRGNACRREKRQVCIGSDYLRFELGSTYGTASSHPNE